MADIVSDAAIMAALGREMTRAVQRQSVAASNLANLDTPGYRTQELQFADALDEQLAPTTLVASHPQHFGTASAVHDRAEIADASDLPTRRDGNNVQLDRELLSLSRAAADFSAAETILAAKFRLVRYAINEGR
jgi:flagellar basal-body rod protein FlgB